jgi:hypothetical protein
MLFAFPMLFFCKLLKISMLTVEAAAEPDNSIESAQLIDSENARIGMISRIAKSTVRSLYSHFPELQEFPNSTFRPSPLGKRAF